MAKKLYELLVIDSQFKTQATTTRADLRNTFEKKRHLFEEKRKTYQPNQEGAAPVVEEQSDIQSTIPSELHWIAGIWTKALDCSYAVADGNTHARGDVVLDNNVVLLHNAPATALLELEKRMGELLELLKAVPTLDPAKGFQLDADKGPNIFKAREVQKTRTQKVMQPLVLHEPTVEHPAQVQVISVDIPIGTIKEQEWSSLVTPARKGVLIERAEEVRRAVKAALHRANAVEMAEPLPTCGQQIFEYILAAE